MPSYFCDVDPRELRVVSSRPQADPLKLARQIASFGASVVGMPPIVAAWRLAYRNPTAASGSALLLARIAEGFAVVRRDRRLVGTMAVTVIFNLFGWPFTSMVAVIGQDSLSLGPGGIGVLAGLWIAIYFIPRPEAINSSSLPKIELYARMVAALLLVLDFGRHYQQRVAPGRNRNGKHRQRKHSRSRSTICKCALRGRIHKP